jgi:Alginate export
MKKIPPIISRILTFIFFVFVFIAGIYHRSSAQSIVISGVFRPRLEVQYGYKAPPDSGAKPQLLFSQRTRLQAFYNSQRFGAYISLQDARVWGDEVVATDNPSVGIHEAWGQYNFNSHASLRAGRQEFKYDNKRLLTDGDWPQQGRSWDALTLKTSFASGWKADLAASYNQQTQTFFGDYYGLNNPKTLDFLWLNKSKFDSNYNYSISGLVIGDGFQSPDTTGIPIRYTYGVYAFLDHHSWGLTLEGYLQSGKTRTVNQAGVTVTNSFQKVSAYMFSINPYFQVTRSFQVGAGIDYLSGSNTLDTNQVYRPDAIYPTLSGTTHCFSPAYGAGDKFYGKIDIFVNIPSDTRNGGLIDNYLRLKYIYDNWNFGLEYHYYLLQNNVEDAEHPGQALSKALGTELDLAAIKDLTKDVNINTGIAFYFPTRSMEFVKSSQISQVGGPTITATYFYLMVTFRPVFFSK